MASPSASRLSVCHLPPGDPGVVSYPQSTWTSFDRYDRYAAIAQLVRSSLGPGAQRVLDVGDTAGYLQLFDPDLRVIGLDLALADEKLPNALPLVGDGARLPFADDTFDAVVSSDVLEHVVPEHRADFVRELRRVSRELVVIAAPYDTEGVAGVEGFVRRYAMLASGAPQPQLEEHYANGLPRLEATVDALRAQSTDVAVVGNGNLWGWLASMLLRFQVEARPALQPLSGGYDSLHNTAFATATPAPPFYRHLVVAWNDRPPELGAEVAPAAPVDLAVLAALLMVANSTEVVRQDVNGLLGAQVLSRLDEMAITMQARLDEASERQAEQSRVVDDLVVRTGDVRDRLEELFQAHMKITAPLIRLRDTLAKVVAPKRGGAS